MSFPKEIITIPDNSAKMLALYNFPIVVIGSHRGTHFNQTLDCILANIVKEGSLFVTKTNSHIHMALNNLQKAIFFIVMGYFHI